jgi:hypothetical protein
MAGVSTQTQTKDRAPGKATKNGRPSCACVSWCQPLNTPNARAFLRGEEELDHAPSDGHGNPTRGL